MAAEAGGRFGPYALLEKLGEGGMGEVWKAVDTRLERMVALKLLKGRDEAARKAMIREADRVLAGEGQLIVAGFRPWSLWGVRSRLSRGNFPPGVRQLLAERRVCDWLALLGYEIIAARRYLHGAYILRARKRVYTMTPIRIRPRERAAVIGSLVKPTSRTRS